MSLCENCKSIDTCVAAGPCLKKCFFFNPTEEYRINNSKEYAIGYEQGRADREKELSELPNEYSEKLWKIAYEKGRADERARVLEELFNLNCKDISQDECDAYRGNCFHCQFDRVKQRAERLKEQDNEAD